MGKDAPWAVESQIEVIQVAFGHVLRDGGHSRGYSCLPWPLDGIARDQNVQDLPLSGPREGQEFMGRDAP